MTLGPGCVANSILKHTLAYFATVVSYTRKMFMKLTPGFNVIKLFPSVIYVFS
jgi:hypothetical protein